MKKSPPSPLPGYPVWAILLFSLCLSPLAGAASIGIAFTSDRDTGAILAAGDSAGVVAQSNWNSSDGSGPDGDDSGTTAGIVPGTGGSLVDDSGSATGTTISWSSNNTWNTNNGTGDGDDKIMNGYIDHTGGAPVTVSFSNIPYAEYDVYVYVGSDGNGRTGTVSDGTTTYGYTTNSNLGGNFPAGYVQTTNSTGGSPSANYAVFSAKTGSSLTITNTRGSSNTGIHAIQIVETVVTPGLPEVENAAPGSVAATSATANGNLVDNGDGADSAALAIYWGTSDGGTDTGAWSNAAGAGSRTSPGSFSAALSGLSPNTEYFYRVFANNSQGSDWAPDSESFTTPAAIPTVTNSSASDILGTSATVGGEVTSTGGETPTLIIYYGDNDGGTNTGAWDSQLDLGLQNGAADGGISGLTPNTQYFFRAAANNSGGTGWAGSSGSFTTPAVTAPTVVNAAASGINGTFATLNGEVTDPGGDEPTVTIYYGTSDAGTSAGSWQFSVSAGGQSDTFSRVVSNLQPTTTYFFRAFVQNTAGSSWAASSLSFTTPVFVPPAVVINEIHYDESDKTRRAEFIEIHNPSDDPVDLSGYYFSDGIDFTFPAATTLAPGGFLVVAEDPATMLSHFGYSGALGPFANGSSLRNSGERILLKDPTGTTVDRVDYGLGFPWPTVGDEIGSPLASPSIELINPLLDNDLGGSWRASGFPASTSGSGGGGPQTLVDSGQSGWIYRKGTSYPAQDGDGDDWWDNGYDDSVDGQWLAGTAVFGFGDGDDTTLLNDMQNNYISFFVRKEFTIAAGQVPNSLTLECYYDDGAAVYINGVEVARFSLDAGAIQFPPPTGFANSHEAAWSSTTLSGTSAYLVEGTNVIAIQCINTSLGSSDTSLDARLITNPGGGGVTSNEPTPGAANSAFANSVPPQIRQVDHLPESPTSGQAVTVTAKITDPDGVGNVTLQYQLVDPGDYFSRYLKFNNNGSANADPRYEDPAEWTSLPMVDDGTGGDALAADSIYTVVLPGALQTNRRLVRYRITADDTPGTGITVPYGDDPQPNFAYFVYDGTPDWSGRIRPGDTPVTYPGALMSSIPTYFLLSKGSYVDDSQFGGYSGSEYLWPGTMVYDGKVYDHIQYRPRGGVHRFQYGKNFWKFDFGRGRRFEARDRYGKRYKTKWDKLNFSSIVQQVNFGHRGEQGLFEGVGFKLFELCGVEACHTHYVQFYVVDQASPTGANQYEGDYYGLFLAIEQMNGQYLDEHDLPDGNLYKIEGHNGDSNNQGPTQVSDGSDVSTFISAYRNSTQTAQWWEDNLDIDKYLSYRTVVEGIHHYDIANGKNYFYYHNPETDKFEVHPWDLDLTWADNMFGSGNHDFKADVAQNSAFNTRYQNRVREIMDLIYNDDEGYRLIDEMVRDVWTPGQPSLVGADRRLWDNNPRINHPDRYYDVANDNDFGGMIQVLKNYIVSRGNWMTSNLLTQENSIPDTPTITFSGASGFPANDLRFTSSAYSSGTGFAAMEWRISEVYNPTTSNYVAGEPYIYEIEDPTESGELGTFDSTYLFSAVAARPGHTYRARVRHKDSAGRWSHWSAPLEFTASAPDVAPYIAALRVSELHYHPLATPAEQTAGWSNSDFEFIELKNVGAATVDLTDLRFTKGVDYDFPPGTTIAAGAYALVVKNQAAFESRYGAGLPVVGEWAADNRLSNGGENLKLSFGAGTAIIEFAYDDIAPWPTSPDGDGFSLTLHCPDATQPGDHANPFAWRASRTATGTPGYDDHLDFSQWGIENGLGANPDLAADTDSDELSHLLEYALASDPNSASNGDLPVAAHQSLNIGGNTATYLTISFRSQPAAKDLDYQVQFSTDLSSWQPGAAIFVSSTENGDGSTTETWRAPTSVGTQPQHFLRLSVTGPAQP